MRNLKQLMALCFLGVMILFVSSCKNDNVDGLSQQETTLEAKLRQIPLEDALATLDAFLKDNDLEMSATRSGMKRTISNVSTYYNKSSANGVTRSSAPDDIPDAYLVNFGENEGFAVLGANENVADIVAVTENGNITEELEIVFVGDNLIIDGVTVEDEYEDTVEDDDLYEIPIETIDWYCAEDDDYYTASESVSDLVSEMIKNGINQPLNYEVVENEEEEQHIGSDVYPTPTPTYVIKEPLLKTNWGQREPYNKYCLRRNLRNQVKSALTGCSTTAMAMIVAYNEFPDTLLVSGDTINWKTIKAYPYITWLPDEDQNDISLLMVSIYNHVKKIAVKKGTLITPKQIEKRMKDFGYINVVRHCSECFNQSMLKSISDMLQENKPVFMSAMSGIDRGHSWVVDGAKCSSSNPDNYLLHFNFGWRGKSNGYFSPTCLNPAKAEEYTDTSYKIKDHTSNDYTYTWHFRIITYDIPSVIHIHSVTM